MKFFNFNRIVILLLLFFIPIFFSFAAETLYNTGYVIYNILNIVIIIILSVAFLYFIYGVSKYMMAKDEKEQGAAKDMMIYGLIGTFVLFSAWGLVTLLKNTFIQNEGATSPQNCKGFDASTYHCLDGQQFMGCNELSIPVCQ